MGEFIQAEVSTTSPTVTNAMTVDVEEYFQVSAFEPHIDATRWDLMPSRVEAAMDRILALFELANVKCTFFTLGYIAERHPQMIRRMVAAGHEIASHGMRHVRANTQDKATFRADVTQARTLLQDISGQPIKGYRAASYSIGRDNLWALDALAEAGYTYSSSIYPIRHDLYGMPEAPRYPFRVKQDGILEIPVTTFELRQRRFPCGGGGFFRAYPYVLSRWAIRRANEQDKQPALFYFHPWEVDPQQPRVPGVSAKTRVRHYLNLKRMEPRLRRLLTDFQWDRMDNVFPVPEAAAEPEPEAGRGKTVVSEIMRKKMAAQ